MRASENGFTAFAIIVISYLQPRHTYSPCVLGAKIGSATFLLLHVMRFAHMQ